MRRRALMREQSGRAVTPKSGKLGEGIVALGLAETVAAPPLGARRQTGPALLFRARP